MKRNTWQLFSNDLDLTEKTLQSARTSPGSFREIASLAQHLTFFGHFDQAQDLLLNSPAAVLRETYGEFRLWGGPLIIPIRSRRRRRPMGISSGRDTC